MYSFKLGDVMSQPYSGTASDSNASMTGDAAVVGGHTAADRADVGSHATAGTTAVPWKENTLGDARAGHGRNVSWGAIFAGVVTFIAIVLLFGLLTAAAGLGGSGTGAAIVSVIGLLLGFFGAGGVAGAMAVRGGLLHGFLAWATSILATVVLLVLLTLGTAGAVGGVLGSLASGLGAAAGPSLTQVDPTKVPTPTAQQTQQAQQTAQAAAQTAADATKTGATWGFIGLLLGAIVASVGGLLGSRSVNSRRKINADDTSRVS